MISVRISAATHTGAVRRRNEDCVGATDLRASSVDGEVVSVVISGGSCIAVVADGLGGHPSGDVASRLAVQQIIGANPADPDALVKAFHAANEAIYDAMSEPCGSLEMGSTAAAVLLRTDGIAVANVGDSAVFEFMDGRLVQLSTDDVPTRGGQLPGLPSTVVTQTLGGRREPVNIEPNLYSDEFGAARSVLMCTDGLTNFVTRDRIAGALRETCGVQAVEALLRLALDAGGRDNVTVLLMEPVRVGDVSISEVGPG
ncbi:MAG: protein phosphatase 2C domain-containing protein [Microthrixaceae bacterium]